MVWRKWTKNSVKKIKPVKNEKPKSILIAQTSDGYGVDVWYSKRKAQHLHYKRMKDAERRFKQLKKKHPKVRTHKW